MGDKVGVLVFPCGSENASEIHQALRYSVHVDLHGASSVDDHGRFRFEQYAGGLPNIRDPEFDRAFAGLVASRGIDVVFATHDSVQEYLAPKAAELGFHLVNGDTRTAEITRRKSETYRLFEDCPWAPSVYTAIEEVETWPIVVKPDAGQGGHGVIVARNPQEAATARDAMPDPVLVEHLPGEEITVDCFTDRNHRLVWVGPRTRERIRAGISMRSTMQKLTPEVEAMASEINRRLALRGPWFFQAKRAGSGQWKLLEISSRVAGTMVAQRAQGVNLPLLAIHDYLGRDVGTLPNPHVRLVERNIATRAEIDFDYGTVFIDLDDTLIIDGFANPIALAFLYQSLSEGKKIVLLTRHASDVGRTLQDARIAANLFDEVIHLRDDSSKADHVTVDAIFIDNHFPERLAVASRWGIPVFDVDAIEFFVR